MTKPTDTSTNTEKMLTKNEVEALLERTTPGPWKMRTDRSPYGPCHVIKSAVTGDVVCTKYNDMTDDIDFIVETPRLAATCLALWEERAKKDEKIRNLEAESEFRLKEWSELEAEFADTAPVAYKEYHRAKEDNDDE